MLKLIHSSLHKETKKDLLILIMCYNTDFPFYDFKQLYTNLTTYFYKHNVIRLNRNI